MADGLYNINVVHGAGSGWFAVCCISLTLFILLLRDAWRRYGLVGVNGRRNVGIWTAVSTMFIYVVSANHAGRYCGFSMNARQAFAISYSSSPTPLVFAITTGSLILLRTLFFILLRCHLGMAVWFSADSRSAGGSCC